MTDSCDAHLIDFLTLLMRQEQNKLLAAECELLRLKLRLRALGVETPLGDGASAGRMVSPDSRQVVGR